MHSFAFVKEFVKDLGTTGSLVPSSRFLIRKMLEPIDFSSAQTVVELGGGTGNLTTALLKNMRPGSRLFCFETNEKFCHFLKEIADDRLSVIPDSAGHISKYVTTADYIVSSLPLVVLPDADGIISEILSILKKEGKFIQYQYSLTTYKKFKRRFSSVSLGFTPFNIPPAFVYSCKI